MTPIDLILFFIASLGIGLSLFFSVVLFRLQIAPPYSNQILAALIFCLTLRIGKSVFYNFTELPLYVKNIGLAFNLAVGPLLFFYGLILVDNHFKLKKEYLLHFIPSSAFLLGCTLIPNNPGDPVWHFSYSLVLLQSFIYVGFGLLIWYRHRQTGHNQMSWYFYLTLGLGSMWVIYLMIFIGWIPVYLAGAFAFTLLVGIVAFLASKRNGFVNLFFKKYTASNLSKEASADIMKKVIGCLEEDEIHLDHEFNLNALASRMGIHPKTLSQVINENSGKSFIQLVNSYRVERAKRLFSQPARQNEKVIAIALDCGFNSLSAFNSVFKQYTGMTPSQFRGQMISV